MEAVKIAGFGYKFILAYAFYIAIWAVVWSAGFGAYYTSNPQFVGQAALSTPFTNNNCQQAYSSFDTRYWIPASQLTQAQLQNLSNGTLINANPAFISGNDVNFTVWVIKDQPTGFCLFGWGSCYDYDIYEYQQNPNDSVGIFWTGITWVYTKTSAGLENISINTTASNFHSTSCLQYPSPTNVLSDFSFIFGFLTGIENFNGGLFPLQILHFALFIAFIFVLIVEVFLPLKPDWL